MPSSAIRAASAAFLLAGISLYALAPARAAEDTPARGAASFRDCPSSEGCPELVALPASPPGFRIGSAASEKGRLQSEDLFAVSVKPFAIGVTEVSVGEYMACVKAGACRHPEWLEPGGMHNIETGSGITYKSMAQSISGDEQPVVGISWDDANAFARWLTAKTGNGYRLPSEAEWEYAARGGTTTRYWWGDEERKDGAVMACCRGCGSAHDGRGLFPVRSFAPNPFGLYNVHGNVWEWVADYHCASYASGPADGSARAAPDCGAGEEPQGLRVFRGGSCFYEPRQMRSAMRLRNAPDFRNQTVGFRIARSLGGKDVKP